MNAFEYLLGTNISFKIGCKLGLVVMVGDWCSEDCGCES